MYGINSTSGSSSTYEQNARSIFLLLSAERTFVVFPCISLKMRFLFPVSYLKDDVRLGMTVVPRVYMNASETT